MKLSIITPIYKAEKDLERCARCLMEQTLKDGIEFIFVDDCSPDNSLSILKHTVSEYVERLEQVKIYSNEHNMGPHDSRLRGIDEAQGEYIGFCDADDWIEPTMFERMLTATNNGEKDIVVCNYICEREGGPEVFPIEPFLHPHEALAQMHEWHKFSWAMWNQLIRKRIIEEEIRHIYPTKFREDTFLMMRCYYRAQSIAYVSEAMYHYNLFGTESLIHTRKQGFDGWLEQKENMDRICNLLYSGPEGKKKFHYGVNNFKFMIKKEFTDVFPTKKDFYYAFRESHFDAVDYERHQSGLLVGLKMWVVLCTSYIIYQKYKG